MTKDIEGRALVFVAGARPNFMKVAPLLRSLRARSQGSACRLVHTGQRYDPSMSSVFFRDLDIPEPDAHLGVGSGGHGAQTGRILASFEEYLLGAPPTRGVVVVGDVNSTVACALTMRETTERPVTVALGTNTIVGHDWDRAEALITDVLEGR